MTLPTVALSELEFGLVDGLFDDQIDGFGAAKPKCNGGSPCRRSRHYLNRPQGPTLSRIDPFGASEHCDVGISPKRAHDMCLTELRDRRDLAAIEARINRSYSNRRESTFGGLVEVQRA